MGPGAAVIGSSSVNSDMPSPTLAPYAATKAAIANFSASLAQLLGDRDIRVNSVAPGPMWTPLFPATMPEEKVANFGDDTPLGLAGGEVNGAQVKHELLGKPNMALNVAAQIPGVEGVDVAYDGDDHPGWSRVAHNERCSSAALQVIGLRFIRFIKLDGAEG